MKVSIIGTCVPYEIFNRIKNKYTFGEFFSSVSPFSFSTEKGSDISIGDVVDNNATNASLLADWDKTVLDKVKSSDIIFLDLMDSRLEIIKYTFKDGTVQYVSLSRAFNDNLNSIEEKLKDKIAKTERINPFYLNDKVLKRLVRDFVVALKNKIPRSKLILLKTGNPRYYFDINGKCEFFKESAIIEKNNELYEKVYKFFMQYMGKIPMIRCDENLYGEEQTAKPFLFHYSQPFYKYTSEMLKHYIDGTLNFKEKIKLYHHYIRNTEMLAINEPKNSSKTNLNVEKIALKVKNSLQKDSNGVSVAMYEALNKKLDTILSLQTKQELLSYYTNNTVKEAKIREKILQGHKVKVFFVVCYQSKFGYDSLYAAMEKSNIFEPTIFIVHPRDLLFDSVDGDRYFDEAKDSYKVFKERGYRTIFAYTENRRPITLDNFSPDILFLNFPNMFDLCSFKNINLNANYLSCYIPYAYYVVENFGYTYNNYHINTAWRSFLPNYFEVNLAAKSALNNGITTVLAGYPKLDAYYKDESEVHIPKKIDNGKPIVIYAPHWSIKTRAQDNNLSTFHLYYKLFMSLLKNNPDINFVYKPHPDLIYRIYRLNRDKVGGVPSVEEYNNYVAEWNNSPNGIVVNDGEYIDLFRKSSCLITDCGSFIAEYLPSGHPCMYLINPDKKDPISGFNKLGQQIINSFYKCYNQNDIITTFDKVVLRGEDPMRTTRETLVKNEFYNLGNAGNFICKYLEEKFKI